MTSLLTDANPPQREAIQHRDGPLLVLAGPGSGKTLVLTRRIAWLMQNGVPAERILAITFTNKAAGEMRERVRRITGLESRWISTFHSFGARILRRFGDRLGYDRDFTIFDDQDQKALLRRCVSSLGLDSQSLTPGAVATIISNYKISRVRPDEATGEASGYRDQQMAAVYKLYETELRRQNAMDFDDLLCRLLDLLQDVPEVRQDLQTRFTHVLVDEYQDTNRVQFEIAAGLAEQHRNLCVTGDPDQSIYRWRGADIRNILEFERTFPEARTVRLEQNYRSTKRVLEVASAVIANNRQRKAKDLWSNNDDGPLVRVAICRDPTDEGAAVASRILELYGAGSPYSEMAILYRTNAQSRSLEQALRERGVPYAILGGVEFFRRREVKDLVAYLRVRTNPQDDVSLERIINVPTRRIGATSIDRIREFAMAQGLSMREAVRRHAEITTLRGVGRTGVARFSALLDTLDGLPVSPVAGALDEVVERVGFEAYLQKEAGKRGGEDRLENVRELLAAASEYDATHPDGDISTFLETVALVADTDSYDPDATRVTLMTLHSAKGLEFDAVFLTGLEEGLLPHQLSLNEQDGLEEERRLLFVGLTRSRRDLLVSAARWRGRWGTASPAVPSRFLEELPPQCIQRVDRDAGLFSDPSTTRDAFDPLVDEDPARDIRKGSLVKHERFGVGRVTAVRGRAGSVRVVVDFRAAGRKEISLDFGHLEVVEEWS